MRLDGDRARQLAVAENLQAVFELLHHAQLEQLAEIEGIALELIEALQVDDGEFLAEDVGESALRQAAVQRHLAAFKSAHRASSRRPTSRPCAPRPEVLPRPEPMPWPTRCLRCFWPVGGLS